MSRFDTPSEFPGQTQVTWRRTRPAIGLAVLSGVLWPPFILTFLVWPPQNWLPGRDFDFRLLAVLIGMIGVPLGLWFVARERRRTGRPSTRLGIVWRFMLYGGLLAASLQVALALIMTVLGWVGSANPMEAIGSTETVLLIYGVLGLPVAILVGVSYALWAGLCAAYLAFMPAPRKVRDRLGLMSGPA
jgi:hypothetical protein